ncbi:MAG: hypothetical protein LC739_10395 [Actinobacteria bacterium]|nr:hypothetical protein [Actinomycetota bacterium]
MESFTLRPLGIPEIIDAAIRIIRRRTRPLVTIAAVVLVPIAIVQYFISRSLQAGVAGLQTISPSADPNEVFEQLMESLGPLLVVSLTTGAIGWLAQLLVLLALTKAIVDIYLDRPPEWKESLRYGRPEWRLRPKAGGPVRGFPVPSIWSRSVFGRCSAFSSSRS